MNSKPGRPRQTSIDAIIDAVLAEGLSTFSMPAVGDRLGVAHSGLYRYVRDREDLLVQALGKVARSAPWPSVELPWREQVVAIGETFWMLCSTYPGYDLASLTTRTISPGFVATLTPYVDSMHAQGLSVVEATAAIDFVRMLALTSSIDATRLGTLAEVPEALEHSIPGFSDPDKWTGRSWYQRHLDTYLDGLALRVTAG